MEKLQKWGVRSLAAVGALIFLFLSVYAFRFTMQIGLASEGLTDSRANLIMPIVLIIVLYEILYRLQGIQKFLTPKRMQILAGVSAVIATFISLRFVIDAHSVTECDQLHLSMMTQDILQRAGERFATGDDYFYCFPGQLGLGSIFAIVQGITGLHSEIVIRYFHAICIGVIVYMGFLIVRELSMDGTNSEDTRAECLYLMSMLLYLPMYLYGLFYYGETLGLCGMFCAIWAFLRLSRAPKNKKQLIGLWCLLLLSLAVMYIARQGLMVVWIAMVLIKLLQLGSKPKEADTNRFVKAQAGNLLGLLIALAIMLGSQALLVQVAESRLETDFGKGVPVISWIAMGMQIHENEELPPGYYNGYQVELFRQNNRNSEAVAELSKQYIAERFAYWKNNPKDMFAFYKGKILGQWNEPTYGAFIMTRLMEDPKPWVYDCYYLDARREWNRYLDAFQVVCFCLVLLQFLRLLKNANDPKQLLLGLILIGGFFFSILWETKSRYIYPYSVLMIPYAMMSLVSCFDELPKFVSKMKSLRQ